MLAMALTCARAGDAVRGEVAFGEEVVTLDRPRCGDARIEQVSDPQRR